MNERGAGGDQNLDLKSLSHPLSDGAERMAKLRPQSRKLSPYHGRQDQDLDVRRRNAGGRGLSSSLPPGLPTQAFGQNAQQMQHELQMQN